MEQHASKSFNMCSFLVVVITLIAMLSGCACPSAPKPTLVPGDFDEDGLPDKIDDSDGDGLSDYDELNTYKTDPTKTDTDSDGMPDAWETQFGLNPLADDAEGDLDKDSIPNLVEFKAGTNPSDKDTDEDTIGDEQELVVAFRTNAIDARDDGKFDFVTGTWVAVDADRDSHLEGYRYDDIAFYNGSGFNGVFLTRSSGGYDVYANNGQVYIDIADEDIYDGENELACYVLGKIEIEYLSPAPIVSFTAEDQEVMTDTDRNGVINALDTDSDDDGMPDWWEARYRLAPTNKADASLDPDTDALTNSEEFRFSTNPRESDSDSDGIPDGVEVESGIDPNNEKDAILDKDGDTLSNILEYQNGTKINGDDSDDDGLRDGDEPKWHFDSDGDGLINALDNDSDDDGLLDGHEVIIGTDPLLADTDGDSLTDGDETIEYYTDPLLTDTDEDAVSDGIEVDKGTDPLIPDTDRDGLTDGQEATDGAYWLEAEDLAREKEQVKDDPDAKQGKALIPRQDGSLFSAQPFGTIPTGTYKYYIRAKSTHSGSRKPAVNLLVDSDGVKLIDVHLLPYVTVTKEIVRPSGMPAVAPVVIRLEVNKNIYRWYSTPKFVIKTASEISLGAECPSDDTVFVDQILLIRMDNINEELTNPLDQDTDGDGVRDGAESWLNAYWFETEDFIYDGNQIHATVDASNSKDIRSEAGSLRLCEISDTSFSYPKGTYQLFIRARKAAKDSNVRLNVDVNYGGEILKENFPDPNFIPGLNSLPFLYEWNPTSSFFLKSPGPISITISQTNNDLVYVDKILLIKYDFKPPVSKEYFGEGEKHRPYPDYLRIDSPYEIGVIDSIYESRIYEDETLERELVLNVPRNIIDPIDPDTDLDEYRYYHDPNLPQIGADGYLKGSEGYLTDGFEIGLGMNPFDIDTDDDAQHWMINKTDSKDLNPLSDDSDGDGIPDGIEDPNDDGWDENVDYTCYADDDTDDDGLGDGNEDADFNRKQTKDDDGNFIETHPKKADSDNDDIYDGIEVGLTVKQGVYNIDTLGQQGDTVFHSDEDPETTTDPLDADSDEDGWLDGTEDPGGNGMADQGETDASKFDTDDDGLSDGLEKGLAAPENEAATDMALFQKDTDTDTKTDPLDPDSDGDGLLDGREDKNHNGKVDIGETDPNNADCDGDSLLDGEEVLTYGSDPLDDDTDGDALKDDAEVNIYRTSPIARDTDNDGLEDNEELEVYTNPIDDDTDDDGLLDGVEVNGWKINVDGAEKDVTSDPTLRDSDGDGLTDGEEYDLKTDPRNDDTDGDGLTDCYEITKYGSDPTRSDKDNDGLDDHIEAKLGTNPNMTDTDGDGINDGLEDADHDGVVDTCEINPTKRDSDGDGIDDDKEVLGQEKRSIFGWDAEEEGHVGILIEGVWKYTFTSEANPVQDTDKQATGGVNYKGSYYDTVKLVEGEDRAFFKIDNVPIGKYRMYMRARGNKDEVFIWYEVGDYLDQNPTDRVSVTEAYRWYSTSDFTVSNEGISLRTWAGSFVDGGVVYLDKILLVNLDIVDYQVESGQITHPNMRDTDLDGIDDLNETYSSGVYWFEAENMEINPQTKGEGFSIAGVEYMPDAINGRAVQKYYPDDVWLLATWLTASPGTYNIWVRAKTWSATEGNHLRICIYDDYPQTMAEDKTFDVEHTDDFYWYGFAYQKDDNKDRLIIKAGQNVYIDKLLIENKYAMGPVTDPLWADTDGDEIVDGQDTRPLEHDDYCDNEPDGLINQVEEEIGTKPDNPDSDGDGLNDGDEYSGDTDPTKPDSDNDGLWDGYTVTVNGVKHDGELYYATDALNPDSDGDGLKDGEEVLIYGTDPLEVDTDGDGLWDGYTVKRNGKTYKGELTLGTIPTDTDSDGDGLNDGDEVYIWKTNPAKRDTDGDKLYDGAEVAGWDIIIYSLRTGAVIETRHVASEPGVKDTDKDGLPDYAEFLKSDPRRSDTDGDGYADKHDINPVGIENISPTITDFSCSEGGKWGYNTFKIRLKAEDQGIQEKINYIKVSVSTTLDSDSKTDHDGDFNHTLKIRWLSGTKLSGVTIDVEVKDLNGNVRRTSKYIPGFADWVKLKSGLEEFLHWAVDTEKYYELSPWSWLFQGDYGACAALSCLEIASYYGKVDYGKLVLAPMKERVRDVQKKSGQEEYVQEWLDWQQEKEKTDPDYPFKNKLEEKNKWVENGMYLVTERQYLNEIKVYETETENDQNPDTNLGKPTFDQVKTQIRDQKDPIFARFKDYYGTGSEEGHAVVIVGYYDMGRLGQYCIIFDTNFGKTIFPKDWNWVTDHLKSFIYVNGVGILE